MNLYSATCICRVQIPTHTLDPSCHRINAAIQPHSFMFFYAVGFLFIKYGIGGKRMSKVERGLDPEALEEFSELISSILIPELICIADKYNYDRDSMIKYTADTINAVSELATFEHYELREDKND